jgi:hypothetical protein
VECDPDEQGREAAEAERRRRRLEEQAAERKVEADGASVRLRAQREQYARETPQGSDHRRPHEHDRRTKEPA